MCQYSVDKEDGIPNDWHFVHYVSRAVGGAGLIIMEMTGVEPDGRITDQDLGLWTDAQVPAYQRIINEVISMIRKSGYRLPMLVEKQRMLLNPSALRIFLLMLFLKRRRMAN